MARHLLCVTIDADPDELAGRTLDREALTWRGLETIHDFVEELDRLQPRWGSIPVTWFVRADRQLRDAFGSALYLFETFQPLWTSALSSSHELAWHPHLYRPATANGHMQLIADPSEAADELRSLWEDVGHAGMRFVSFRNGEGWHDRATVSAVERLGFHNDSTAIPGLRGERGHPMNWVGTPNSPYFPDHEDIRRPGAPRPILEIPMNSWLVKAPYDPAPRLRYMNPAIHQDLFSAALENVRGSFGAGLSIWTFILHPWEVDARAPIDALYARSPIVARENLNAFAMAIEELGHDVRFSTMASAGSEWRRAAGQ